MKKIKKETIYNDDEYVGELVNGDYFYFYFISKPLKINTIYHIKFSRDYNGDVYGYNIKKGGQITINLGSDYIKAIYDLAYYPIDIKSVKNIINWRKNIKYE